MKYYLIDSENVGDFCIPLLDLPADRAELIVFYTKNSPHMSYDSLIKLKESDRKVTFIKCYEGTNALDFQLCTQLGFLIALHEKDDFIIVTNDTGYDAAVKFWRRKEYSVKRIAGKDARTGSRRRGNLARTDVAAEVSSILNKLVQIPDNDDMDTAGAALSAAPQGGTDADETMEDAREDSDVAYEDDVDLTQDPEEAYPEDEDSEYDESSDGDFEDGDLEDDGLEDDDLEDDELDDEDYEDDGLLEEDPDDDESEEDSQDVESEDGDSKDEDSLYDESSEDEDVSGASVDFDEGEEEPYVESTVEPNAEMPSDAAEEISYSDTQDSDAQDKAAQDSDTQGEDAMEQKVFSPDPDEITAIVNCIGRDNLAELHNQLIQFYGDNGKDVYLSLKSNALSIEKKGWSKEEKFLYYCALILRHSDEPEEALREENIRELAEFLLGAENKRKNLNSLRYALLKHYGKEKGRRYYFMLKPYVKALNQM